MSNQRCRECDRLSGLLTEAHAALRRHKHGTAELTAQLSKATLERDVLRRQKGAVDRVLKQRGLPRPPDEAAHAPLLALTRLVAAYSGIKTNGAVPPDLAAMAARWAVRTVGRDGQPISPLHTLRRVARRVLSSLEEGKEAEDATEKG